MADGAICGVDGPFYLANKVTAYRKIANFKVHVDNIANEYLGSQRAQGVDRLYLPSEKRE